MRILLLLPLLAACGVDSVGANGELGNMTFGLVSDWYLDQSNLTEVGIVTGHAQSFIVALTEKGERIADGNADAIHYTMEPDAGVTIVQSGPDSEEEGELDVPPSLSLQVTEPGSYALQASLEGELVDRIQLLFATPAALELSLYTRAPWAEDFEALEATEPSQVLEGTQLAWLPIPVGADGVRLVGDVVAGLSADPIEAVVPADNVEHVNEDEVYDQAQVPSLYFIEPGEVTVTLTDAANGAIGAHAFVVTE